MASRKPPAVTNLQERVATEVLDGLLAERPEVCGCAWCRADMLALALNQLPPKYVVHARGQTFSRLEIDDTPGRARLAAALTKALKKVGAKPRHDE